MDTNTLAGLRDCLFAAYVLFPVLLLVVGPALVRALERARPTTRALESEWEDFEYLPLPSRRWPMLAE